jgi:hypothetical protein
MSSLKSKAYRLSVMAAGVAGFLAAGLPQASAQQIPQGWFKACSKQEDVDICNVQNIVTAGNGQLVTGVSMIDLRGKVNRKVFQVTVPSGRLVPPGIALQVAEARLRDLFPGPLRGRSSDDRSARCVVQERLGHSADLCQFPESAEPDPDFAGRLHRRL